MVLKKKGTGAQILSGTQNRVLGGGHIPHVPPKITTPPLSNLQSG